MAATRLIALHVNKGKTVAQCLADRTDYSQNAAKTKVTPREMVAIEKALSVSLAMEQLKKRSTKHKAKKTKE